MNLFKFSLLSFVLSLSIMLPSATFAVAKAPVAAPTTVKTIAQPASTPTVVATVNIENARILSQSGNTFNVAFELTNKTGLQAGVKYGVQLVADGAKYISDEKVYDESLTLLENSVEKREIKYVAPSTLSGNYTLYLVSNNESSFPFGIAMLGKAKLTATTKSLQIQNDSCYLTVDGDKSSKHYTLSQNVDIDLYENLSLTCSAINNTANAISATPYFETRYFSSFGKIAAQQGGSYTSVSFAKGEKKSFTLSIPKGDAPQFYSLNVALMSSNVTSNTINAHYIIRGVNASIQKLSLDKDYYKMGDKGSITLLWQASAGKFVRSTAGPVVLPKVSFAATITDDDGRECASPIKQELVRDLKNPQTNIAFNTKYNCLNPKVTATISDEKGKVLDQKEYTFKSDTKNVKPVGFSSILLMALALIIIIGLGVYMKKKKVNDNQ